MGGLFERAAELSAVGELLALVAGGSGGALLLSGPAGIGRSALVAHSELAARDAGFTVLGSRPTPVSPTLAHALVRDWLGPIVRTGQPGTPPLDGPAAALATALAAPSTNPPDWNLATLDHALTWALHGLAASRPLLLVVDDVQWLDVASLQLLDLLSARVGSMAAGLLVTLRTGEPSPSSDIVDRIATRARVLEPARFTMAGVDRLIRETGPAGVAVPAKELHRLTGGVPFLVQGWLRGARGESVPSDVVEWLRERLVRLGPAADRVARTVAVLGEDAHLDAVADLVGLSVAELADPLERLTGADVLAVEMWRARPAYPLLADAILSGLAASERSDLHREAATYLSDVGADARSVAEHLVHTLPGEDPAVVTFLERAGEEALEAGMPEVAARLLLRAVAETRPDDTASEVLAQAATAQLLSGKPTEAFALWDRAVERAPDASTRAAVLTRVGDAQAALGRWPDAAEAYRQASSVLAEAPARDTCGLSARRALLRAWCDGAGAGAGADLEQPGEVDTHTDRLRSALAAFELALRGGGRERARDLARRALADDVLLTEEVWGGPGFYTAAAVLSWADAHAESLRVLNAAVKEAHQRGSVPGIATASYWRGLVHFRQGRLRQATGDFLAALSLRAEGWSDFGEPAVAGAALTHVSLGQHEAALALEPALRASAANGRFAGALPLTAAGLVRASHGDHEQAVRDFRRAARLMGSHRDNGSIVEWREFSVWSLKALGRYDEALAAAEEAVHHARRWGAPRALGFALRTLAQVTPRDQGIELLREAIGWFDEGGSVDYRARACTDLGRLLLTGAADERAEGVALLHQALAYGRARHVPSAVLRATRLLVRAGEEVSDPSADPAASLTPGERRVVDLAAAGHTNRQIAQRLSVTVKAVEWHLSHAYRKLDVSSRSELTAALYGESGPSSSSAM